MEALGGQPIATQPSERTPVTPLRISMKQQGAAEPLTGARYYMLICRLEL